MSMDMFPLPPPVGRGEGGGRCRGSPRWRNGWWWRSESNRLCTGLPFYRRAGLHSPISTIVRPPFEHTKKPPSPVLTVRAALDVGEALRRHDGEPDLGG